MKRPREISCHIQTIDPIQKASVSVQRHVNTVQTYQKLCVTHFLEQFSNARYFTNNTIEIKYPFLIYEGVLIMLLPKAPPVVDPLLMICAA